MRAVGYCRFSSEQQRGGYSIDAQKDAITAYCKAKDLKLLKFYVDEAKTGTKDKRDEFQQMIDDAKSKLFDVVIVHKLDRFSRNRYDFAVYKKILKDHGITLVSVTEDFDMSKPESIMLEGMIESMAEFYSANLSRETKKGLYERARKGLVSGVVPIGFLNGKDGHYQIDEETKQIPIDIFNRIASGETLASVVRNLKERGLRGKKGAYFSHQAIEKMIKNTLYYGTLTFSYGKGDPIVVPEVVSPLVSKELWALANTKIKDHARQAYPRHKGDEYALTGIMYCGYCGSKMTGYTHSWHGKSVKYYRCISTPHKTDHCPFIKKDEIEKQVFDIVMRDMTSPKVIKEICAEINQRIKERSKSDDALKSRANVVRLEKERNRLLEAMVKGVVPLELYTKKSQELESEYALAQRKEKFFGVGRMPDVTPAELRAAFTYYLNKWSEEKGLYLFFSQLIEKVVVYRDHFVITYRCPLEVFNGNYGGRCLSLDKGSYRGETIRSPFALSGLSWAAFRIIGC